MSLILDSSLGYFTPELPNNCLYISKDLTQMYVNHGPSAKDEEGMYRVFVQFEKRVKEGDVFTIKGKIREVVRGDRTSRQEVSLDEKENAGLMKRISTLFPRA